MVTLTFPHDYKLNNGEIVKIDYLKASQFKEYFEFLHDLHETDKLYLKYNVDNKDFVKERVQTIDKGSRVSIVAWDKNNKIVGSATVYWSTFGWKSHIGKIRLIVDSKHRHIGLSNYLAQLIFFKAQSLHLAKLQVEMMKEQDKAFHIFESLGFIKEAELKNFIIDTHGQKHDLILMTADLHELLDNYEEMMLEQDSKGG